MAKRKLNEKQKRFAVEYIIDLNATQAAIRAGYSVETAGSQGHDLLKNPEITELIQKAMDKRAVRVNVTADRVLAELSRLAFSNIGDYVGAGAVGGLHLGDLDRDQWAAVQEITEDTTGGSGDGERKLVLRTKLKLADKGLNLERLGRHLKLFTDKIEVNDGARLIERLKAGRKKAQER